MSPLLPAHLSVSAGFGQPYGGVGLAGEYFAVPGHVALTAGAGYLPQRDGYGGWPAGAIGLRAYRGQRHRLFADALLLPLFLERSITVSGVPGNVQIVQGRRVLYGPALSGGYSFRARNGVTLSTSLGLGWCPAAADVAGVGSVALGYTWH
jgi:hypothetical protein